MKYEKIRKTVLEAILEAVDQGLIHGTSGNIAMRDDEDDVIAITPSGISYTGMKPEDIDYINVHGTSTPVGDVSEVKAIKDLFGEHAYKLNISSTKSMTGHLLGATGGVEAIACVLSVKNDIVPPTINHEEGDNDENIDYNLNFTFNKAQQRTVRAALSNTFGFGGHNACVIIKKYTE